MFWASIHVCACLCAQVCVCVTRISTWIRLMPETNCLCCHKQFTIRGNWMKCNARQQGREIRSRGGGGRRSCYVHGLQFYFLPHYYLTQIFLTSRLRLRLRRFLVLPFSPTKGRDHVKTSIKLGSQQGCGLQLNWRMFITLFSYFNTAAQGRER